MYDEKYDIKRLVDLLFAENSRHMNIFNTEYVCLQYTGGCSNESLHYYSFGDSVKAANAVHVRPGDRSSAHALEIFDVKVTSIGVRGEEGARLNVSLLVKRSDDGTTRLKVLMVKKNETKNVTFDTLNLHRYIIVWYGLGLTLIILYLVIPKYCRQHDVRIGLHHYECVQDGDPLYAVVREMVGRISFPSRNKARIQPKKARWNIHLIRHKKKLTYMLDDSFAVTISDISELSFDVRKGEGVEFDMRMDNTHVEVEVYNIIIYT